MRLTLATAFALAISPVFSQSGPAGTGEQMVLNSEHNVTSLEGTWSSGSRAVVTGAGFANPVNRTFTFPVNTGVSFSFLNSGFYEIAQYRFFGNGSAPNCITGTTTWEHGTFVILGNASIITTPFGDGFQQVQNPCLATSSFIQSYNYTGLYRSFRIFQDPVDGPKLQIANFDDSPVAPLFLVSATPSMLPTRPLINVTATAAASKRELKKRSAGERAWTSASAGALVLSLVTAAATSIIL
ncbi:chaperone for protein-folding within the ER, fungal-domain-containing protein [Cytidiella melzeri]|nr:chaperone for protein-folding within the ER, fungal-domain-containing protein [Cytidiella melzeri]